MYKMFGYVFRKIEQSVTFAAEHLGMTLLVLMTLVVCLTAFTRYAFHYVPSWGEELALMSMVWFGFLSIALGVRDDGHIGVTILDPLLPKKVLYCFNLFKWACVLAFGVFMVTEGIGITKGGMKSKMTGLAISSGWLYVIVPVAGAFIVVYCLEKIVGLIAAGCQCEPEQNGGDQ